MKKNNLSTFKRILAFATVGILAVGVAYYILVSRGPIYEFNPARDTKPILELFEKNWYWLVSSPDYSPEYMLKNRAPDRTLANRGRLSIKVLRENNAFVGFAAYYMKTATQGFILFVSVKSAFRSKGYGRQLARYAIDDLISKGAKKVLLLTRVENFAAQALYKRLGFHEIDRDDTYVFFAYAAP